VRTAFVVFESAKSRLGSNEIIAAGLPIRADIMYRERPESKKLRVLVFGGSQGARAINYAVAEAWNKSPTLRENIELYHQTGKLDYEDLIKKYKGTDLQCVPFIEDMASALNWADLVIARGGVGSVSEIIASRKASIIVPLPTAAENHQEANAKYLVNKSAAEMILQKDFTPDSVIAKLLDYKSHPQRIKMTEEALKSLQRPNGAKQIADFILKRVTQEKG
jgi:UDP-N-acetylglucosamine--N-acetylmuramyl-(pentapeptide) pyrophosphoryl-undecaprenol N-acetylglucosamine transferase